MSLNFFRNLKSWPPIRRPLIDSIIDPDFGTLTFFDSYWEGEWKFPVTNTTISIALPGTDEGPNPLAREFYLSLPERFNKIIAACRPKLQQTFTNRLGRELPEDIFSVVSLAGVHIENLSENSNHWSILFEVTCESCFFLAEIPFIDDIPQLVSLDS